MSYTHYLTVDERCYDSLSRWLFTLYRISFPLRHMHISNVRWEIQAWACNISGDVLMYAKLYYGYTCYSVHFDAMISIEILCAIIHYI